MTADHEVVDVHADFWAVVETARSLTREQADVLQAAYERRWDSDTDRASGVAHRAARRTGRVGANFSDDPVWQALDELSGISGGAADAAGAVLARDLIDPAEYALLTRGWRDVGLGLPGPLVEAPMSRHGISVMHPVRVAMVSGQFIGALILLAYFAGHGPFQDHVVGVGVCAALGVIAADAVNRLIARWHAA